MLFAVWLAFFPNAPYLVTDIVHYHHRPVAPYWYDILLVFTFAWNGVVIGFVSLRILQNVIENWFGKWIGWGFVGFAVSAAGFGVYLGRFLRWNSWDVLANPQALLYDILVRLIYPFQHPQTYGFTILLSAFLLLGYATMNLIVSAKWQEERVYMERD
ncbi:DUF1361 domain-containing protein [Chloroflexi bacterium TSY]|nr:DUF1361 domain-containing protein [Chloroflexi bacterium TSY]